MQSPCRRWAVATAVVVGAAVAAGAGVAAQEQPYILNRRISRYEWTEIDSMTDEWNSFDTAKWRDLNPRWLGRAPSVFKAENVQSVAGNLQLRSAYDPIHSYPANPPSMPAEPRVYGNWTTSFCESRTLARYGYFEVHARPGSSAISSSFWLSWNTPTDWTELDVFEIGGGAVGGPGPGFPYVMFMNTHVFRRTGTSFTPASVLSTPGNYFNPAPLANSFHIYGLDWNSRSIDWNFDGRPVRRLRNIYHQQSLAVKVDSETMPNWFGLPDSNFVEQVFVVDWLRTWSRRNRGTRISRDVRGGVVIVEDDGMSGGDESLVEGAGGEAYISPYALQRAPMPGSLEVAGLGAPVPRAGWAAYQGIGPVPRSVAYVGPVPV